MQQAGIIRGEKQFGPFSRGSYGFRIELPKGRTVTFSGRRSRGEQLQSVEIERISNPPPLIFVSDFGYDQAPVECRLIMDATFSHFGVKPPKIEDAHHVAKFGIDHGSRIIAQLARGAREGAVIVGVVDPGVGSTGDKKRRRIIVRTGKNHIAVGPDNGLFSELYRQEGVFEAWEINSPVVDQLRSEIVTEQGLFYNTSTTFEGREYFAPVGAIIAAGGQIDNIGTRIDPESLATREVARGSVVDVDTFGDVKVFEPQPDGATLLYLERLIEEEIVEIPIPFGKTYADVPIGQLIALKSSNDYLEIAVREGNASEQLGIRVDDMLKIRWEIPDQPKYE